MCPSKNPRKCPSFSLEVGTHLCTFSLAIGFGRIRLFRTCPNPKQDSLPNSSNPKPKCQVIVNNKIVTLRSLLLVMYMYDILIESHFFSFFLNELQALNLPIPFQSTFFSFSYFQNGNGHHEIVIIIPIDFRAKWKKECTLIKAVRLPF